MYTSLLTYVIMFGWPYIDFRFCIPVLPIVLTYWAIWFNHKEKNLVPLVRAVLCILVFLYRARRACIQRSHFPIRR